MPQIQADELTHSDIIKIMQNMGYENVSQGGVCHGFHMMGIQAFLSGGQQAFRERLNFIAQHINFKNEFDILEKKKELNQLSSEENDLLAKYLDAKSFFDGIHIYQSPTKNKMLFPNFYTQQNIGSISKYVQSVALHDVGGLISLDSNPNVYSKIGMKEYLDTLSSILKKHNVDAAISVTSGFHSIALYFNPTSGQDGSWSIIDANHMTLPNLPASFNHLVAKGVCELSHIIENTKPDERFTLNFQTFTTADKINKLAIAWDEFKSTDVYKNLHLINSDKINFKRDDGLGRSLLVSALFNGNVDVVREITNKDPKSLEKIEKAAISIAARHNHPKLLEEFFNQGIELDQPLTGYYEGRTVAHVAAKSGSIEMLRLLDRFGVDLSKKNSNFHHLFKSKKPIDYAKKYNRGKATQFIESVSKRESLNKEMLALEKKFKNKDVERTIKISFLRNQMLDNWRELDAEDNYKSFDADSWREQLHELTKKKKSASSTAQTLESLHPVSKAPSLMETIKLSLTRSKSTAGQEWLACLIADSSYREVDTAMANKILKHAHPGAYILRQSNAKDAITLSYVDDEESVKHLQCSYQDFRECKKGGELLAKFIAKHPRNKLKELDMHPLTQGMKRQVSADQDVNHVERTSSFKK